MARSNEKEAKVFDVAKPEDAKLDVGSKPMVIGHKALASDPSIREVSQDAGMEVKSESTSELKPAAATKKIVLAPLTTTENDAATVSKTDVDKIADTETTEGSKKVDAAPSTEQSTPMPQQSSAASKDTDPNEEIVAENAAVVEELIKSKKYALHIKEKKSVSAGTIVKVCIVFLCAAVAVVLALLYTDTVESPFDLPFRSEELSVVATQQVADTTAAEPQSTEKVAETTEQQTVEPLYTMTYPTTWQKETVYEDTEQGTVFIDTYTLPSGTVLTIQQDLGGRGGACEPDAADEPHAAGNACPTLELLEKTVLTTDAAPQQTTYLTEERFTDIAGMSTYSICVRSLSDETFNPAVDEPLMGAFSTGCGPGVALSADMGYIIVSVTGIDTSDDTYFDDADVVAIKAALQTLQLL